MRHRRPQDPEGSAARRFGAWLRRDPERRRALLRRRLTSLYTDSELIGALTVGLLLFAILGMGLWRLLFGTAFP